VPKRKDSDEIAANKYSFSSHESDVDTSPPAKNNYFDKFDQKYAPLRKQKFKLSTKHEYVKQPKRYFLCLDHPERVIKGLGAVGHHVAKHPCPDLVRCCNCDARFASCYELAAHIRKVHYENKATTFVCPHTGRRVEGFSKLGVYISMTKEYWVANVKFLEEPEALYLMEQEDEDETKRPNRKRKRFD
jgi:hypothetical protein